MQIGRRKIRRKSLLIFGLLFSLCCTGCGGSANSVATESMKMTEGAFYDAPMMEEAVIMESSAAEPGDHSPSDYKENTERKLIKTVELSLETDHYDELMVSLEEQILTLGGYIEYKDAYHGNLYSQYEQRANRNASLTVRIPAGRLEEFTGAVSEIGNITYESESVEDVTLQYVDLSSHKKMLQTQQDRLLELLETAETMEDIIALEGRLSEVRYEIESMESQLRTYDNLVDYSTVRLNIQEVERYSPKPQETIGQRILQGLSDNTYKVLTGILNFSVEFIIALPILLLVAVLLFVFLLLWRIVKKVLAKKGVQRGEGKGKKWSFKRKNSDEE